MATSRAKKPFSRLLTLSSRKRQKSRDGASEDNFIFYLSTVIQIWRHFGTVINSAHRKRLVYRNGVGVELKLRFAI